LRVVVATVEGAGEEEAGEEAEAGAGEAIEPQRFVRSP
jgi:hypothetical protein